MAARIENQPPTEKDREFWQMSADYATEIIRAIQEHVRTASPTARALELLKNRILAAMNSLWVLRKHAPHAFGFDGMMVLRGIYDAHLQALYILSDPKTSDERATLYLDYQWVEIHRLKGMMDSNDTDLARTLRESPKRVAAEPLQIAEFRRVRANYLNEDGKLLRQWYRGDLRTLAKAPGVDLESEYEIMQRHLSGAVHSSPLSLVTGPVLHGETFLEMGWHMVFRVLGRIAYVHGAVLGPQLAWVVEDSRRNLFDGPTPRPPQSGSEEPG
jgi:hypothetical protein